MSGLSWWANRKSRMGLKPSAKAPPHLPNGRAWWTSPPVMCPQPDHIEYVVQYQHELIRMRNGREKQEMQARVAEWLRAARRLLHQEAQAPERADLHTTDGLIVAACRALHKMCSRIYGLGGEVDGEVVQIMDAVQGRADRIRQDRAIESAKRTTLDDDGKRGRGQTVPHETQQGANTPGQRASVAAGNVADSHCTPIRRHRSAEPSSSPIPPAGKP